AAYDGNLLRTGGSEFTFTGVDAVLKPNAHVRAVECAHRGKWQLVSSGGHHRPPILVSEQLVGYSLCMKQIFSICPLPPQHSKYCLHEYRRLNKLAIEK